ncbi:MAG: hypothetical protein M1828_002381, partial [Chrysothrix sp. TS-e1954]
MPDNIASYLDSIDIKSFDGDDVGRAKALEAAHQLIYRLEKPWDTLPRWFWREPYTHLATSIALDLKIFETLADGVPKSIEQLAVKSGQQVDHAFLNRMMRMLAGVRVVVQLSQDSYQATELSKALATPEAAASVALTNDLTLTMITKLPAYYREHGYKIFTDPANCPFQRGLQTKSTFFQWLGENTKQVSDFSLLMQGWSAAHTNWAVWTPTASFFSQDDKDAPFLVDVGGSVGHDVEGFRQKHPETEGRLVCQDKPEVVAIANGHAGIKFMAHDFWTPQPVAGARIYFLHAILHDWPDEKSRLIIQNIKLAMKKGYSKLLVQDFIIPDVNPDPLATGIDLNMMQLFGAGERTESQWHALFASVGMKIEHVHKSPLHPQAVFEVDFS